MPPPLLPAKEQHEYPLCLLTIDNFLSLYIIVLTNQVGHANIIMTTPLERLYSLNIVDVLVVRFYSNQDCKDYILR